MNVTAHSDHIVATSVHRATADALVRRRPDARRAEPSAIERDMWDVFEDGVAYRPAAHRPPCAGC